VAVSRFVAIYLLVAVLAVVAAVATWLLAPPAVAPVAVTSAVLTTISLALAIRSTLVDRADLRADIGKNFYSISDNVVVEVRLYNRGRRPIKVEEMGWAVTKGTPLSAYPYWSNWSTRGRAPELPISLGESDSSKLWTWPANVARWLLRHSTPGWMWARDHAGEFHWFKVPADVVESVRVEWPNAKAQYEKELAEKAAKEAKGEPAVDDYGQPIGGPEPLT
jgi:hypothetical protein